MATTPKSGPTPGEATPSTTDVGGLDPTPIGSASPATPRGTSAAPMPAQVGVDALDAVAKLAGSSSGATFVLDQIVQIVARTLDVPFCKVLALLSDERHLLLCAGVGWQPGAVGSATVSAGNETQAGYTLQAGEPVIVTNVQRTKLFRGVTMLHQHGLTSGISAPILESGQPVGVISVHTIQPRHFAPGEADFLAGVARYLGPSVRRMAGARLGGPDDSGSGSGAVVSGS